MMRFFTKNKAKVTELLRYFCIGTSITFLNIFLYTVLCKVGIDYKLANLIAIVISKVYGYFSNKLIVFKAHCGTVTSLLYEVVKYIFSRGLTGLIDYFGLIILVEMFLFNKSIAKYFVQIVVIVLNYILSKHVVFKGKGDRGAV